ncbi:MAG: sugar phosphate nucleotidyltransferase [Bdellovibrionota bacterium]
MISTQAMILNAGLSTRMRPLTLDKPKSILPLLDRRMLDWSCDYLRFFGVQEVACNVHHGKEAFYQEHQRQEFPLPLTLFEEKTLRGTGGGIAGMQSFVKGQHVWVINCDFLCEVDLRKVAQTHEKSGALVTMVTIPNAQPDRYSSLGIGPDGVITALSSYQNTNVPTIKEEMF